MKYKIDWPNRGHLYNNAELNDLNSFLNEKIHLFLKVIMC